MAHYLDALEWQKEIVKIHAVFGGKNPHPNYLVGGVPCSIDVDEVAAINTERLNLVGSLIAKADEFVNQVYVPDLLAVASFYKDWAKWGGGLKNYLSYGEYPTQGYNKPEAFKYPRGAILNRDLSHVYPVNPKDSQEIKEYIASSWYTYAGGDQVSLHPWEGETEIKYSGPQPPFETLEGYEKYSFLKTPRWKDNPMEVGPLARLLVAYASGHDDVKELVGQTLGKLGVPVDALFSTLGRTAARGLSAALGSGLAEGVLRSTDRAREDTRDVDLQQREVGPEHLAERSRGCRTRRSSARCSRSLDQDQGRQDRELPACGSDHLEWVSARRQEAALFV